MTSVLLVDDERDLLSLLDFNLRAAGFETVLATTGEQALAQLRRRVPDLVVLDLMLPDLSGTEVCRQIKSDPRTKHVPVVMLTAKGDEVDRVVGFEIGADDYVTKPFSPRELALRVQSVLRRARGASLPAGTGVLRDGELTVDVGAHEVRLHGDEIMLTAREFDLLAHMMRNPRQAFSRSALLDQVWGWSFGDSSTVTVHVRRLREKIEPDPTAPRRIVTVWGVGYRYEPLAES
jgi:DNA-binding response OmpR family regulator